MLERKRAHIVNALIKLRHTLNLFSWFTCVEITSRCACCPIVRTYKNLCIYLYLSRGACPRDLHNMTHIMQTIATPM